MKFILTIALLMITVVLCAKFEDRLPPPIKWLYAGWKKFAHILGTIMNFVILTILWMVGFGIYAIILKIIRLPARFSPKKESYWIPASSSTQDSMRHQF